MAMTQQDYEEMREEKRREQRRERSRTANLYGSIEGCDGDPEPDVPCSECGALIPLSDATLVWEGSGYVEQCSVCADEAFQEEGPEYSPEHWSDRMEDD